MSSSAKGTTPAGTRTEEQAARWVRRMFDSVAPRYDFLNHLLSLNMDRRWRRRTVTRISTELSHPGVRAVDLCCGSGDLLLAMQVNCPAPVLGSDFSHQMLRVASGKVRRGLLFESDALRLPLAGNSVDIITAAFGFRNLASYQAGLLEILRVLRPGGIAAILEFSTPPNPLFRAFYNFYSRQVLPRIGGFVSGSPEAYAYLPESVRKFPGAEDLARQMRESGFSDVGFERMTMGIVALHTGRKPR
jgi:demethylmenaquinone methyltransferase/2-methoxy-6-polyprenyl-1,4-benzoquinol methylase